jgi:hypothetical protein
MQGARSTPDLSYVQTQKMGTSSQLANSQDLFLLPGCGFPRLCTIVPWPTTMAACLSAYELPHPAQEQRPVLKPEPQTLGGHHILVPTSKMAFPFSNHSLFRTPWDYFASFRILFRFCNCFVCQCQTLKSLVYHTTNLVPLYLVQILTFQSLRLLSSY